MCWLRCIEENIFGIRVENIVFGPCLHVVMGAKGDGIRVGEWLVVRFGVG